MWILRRETLDGDQTRHASRHPRIALSAGSTHGKNILLAVTIAALAACGGSRALAPTSSQPPSQRQASGPSGPLSWPALGGSDLPAVGGGENDAVVIVAVEKYQDLAPVAGAIESADDWYDYFHRELLVPAARLEVVKVKVTAKKMRDAVKRAATQAADADGRLWFVFIGHGAPVVDASNGGADAPDGLLVDSRALADELTGLKHSELLSLMEPAARGGQMPVAILDACYSGKVADDAGSARSLTGGAMTEFQFSPPAVRDVVVLSAAASDQIAYPLPGLPRRRPAFSYLLLGGLRGWADAKRNDGNEDGTVTAGEAIGFAQMALGQLGREQRPQLAGARGVELSRAGVVPDVDIREYANLLATAGGQPGCSDGSAWREGKCRPLARNPCGDGFELQADKCIPTDSIHCPDGYRLEPARGCVPVVEALIVTSGGAASNQAPDDTKRPTSEDMVMIAGGTFSMGSRDGEQDEQPVHRVTLSSFELDRHEVTVGEFARCVRAGACAPATTAAYAPGARATYLQTLSALCNGNRTDRLDHPINCVDASQAETYCRWRGARLPTEAEWEYAARGVQSRTYPWGEGAPTSDRAVTSVNGEKREGTAPVCTKAAGNTPEGVCDLAGNVWEWVSDHEGPYEASAQTDPQGGSGRFRVDRGGSAHSDKAALLRAANRNAVAPAVRSTVLGFRCASGAERPAATVRTEDERGARLASFLKAYDAYASGYHEDARSRFQEYLKRYPGDERCGEALYWIGASYTVQGQPDRALREYRKVVEEFPQSKAVDTALYGMADSLFKLADTTLDPKAACTKAKEAAIALLSRDPAPDLEKRAHKLLDTIRKAQRCMVH